MLSEFDAGVMRFNPSLACAEYLSTGSVPEEKGRLFWRSRLYLSRHAPTQRFLINAIFTAQSAMSHGRRHIHANAWRGFFTEPERMISAGARKCPLSRRPDSY
jgi:hypothetical protein